MPGTGRDSDLRCTDERRHRPGGDLPPERAATVAERDWYDFRRRIRTKPAAPLPRPGSLNAKATSFEYLA